MRRATEVQSGVTFVAALFIAIAVSFFILPHVAEAFSLKSMFGSVFGTSRASAAEVRPAQFIHRPSETPALKAALNIDPSPAKGGGDITVVGGIALQAEMGPSGTAADIESYRPGSDQISIYVVREGDSLSQIAEMFGVSTNTLIWANDLRRGNVIRPGETLVILPVSGVRHTVVRGDTLESIVKRYQGDMDEVLEYNNLRAGASLAVGDVVTVPYGMVPQAIAAPASPTRAPAATGTPVTDGFFMRPIAGGVRTQGIHGYNAVDIAAPTGANVLASASGEVIVSRSFGYNGGYGQYIVIRHENGTQTLYAHLSQNYVSAGARVVQGQVIGAVGSTGRSTGPHLHFEVRGARNPF